MGGGHGSGIGGGSSGGGSMDGGVGSGGSGITAPDMDTSFDLDDDLSP